MIWLLPLTISSPPLTLNGRDHWRVKADKTAALRHEAKIRVRAANLPKCTRIQFRLVYQPRDRRRRDPSNFLATQKPLLDGVVDSGIIPDDCPPYVDELMPKILKPQPGEPSRCFMEIRRVI